MSLVRFALKKLWGLQILGYSPSFDKDQIVIGYYNASNQEYTELLTSLDSINDKNDKVFYVNPSYMNTTSERPKRKSAHFSDISSAVKYLKRYRESTGAPHIPNLCLLDGTHIVSEPIVIDFPLKIFGTSQNCIIEPQIGSGISLSTGDLSFSTTTTFESNSIFKLEKNSNDSNIFSMENINFKYSASSNGVICGILIK